MASSVGRVYRRAKSDTKRVRLPFHKMFLSWTQTEADGDVLWEKLGFKSHEQVWTLAVLHVLRSRKAGVSGIQRSCLLKMFDLEKMILFPLKMQLP